MSNQRRGNWTTASASSVTSDAQAMKLRNFFRDAKELLENNADIVLDNISELQLDN